jgi:hypothetical protein
MTPEVEGVVLSIERPFEWGGLLLADRDAEILPEVERGATIGANQNAIWLVVRHAQDFDFTNEELGKPTVRVEVSIGLPETPCDFEGIIELLSGHLTVGDADDEQVVEVPSGIYRIQISLDQPNHAEAVHVWLSKPPTT